MELTEATAGVLLVAAVLVALVALGVAAVALRGQRAVRRAYRVFSRDSREDVLTLLRSHIEEVQGLRGDVAALREYTATLRELIAAGLSRVATVRYDAFDDMGGRVSFSTALLDEHGDGLVLTAINGRAETRTYAKGIRGGRSRHNLSEEEQTAVERALAMRGRAVAERAGSAARRPEGAVEAS